MFNRPHHQNIVRFLEKLDAELLEQAGCFFGGGTAIVLATNEYRESVDVDFLCASEDGYRQIRELVSDNDLNKLAREPIQLIRDVRKDRDKIYTVIDAGAGERPIKFELVREARIPLTGQRIPGLPVATLSHVDLYAEKILANADRWRDASVMYRDAIDLAMMIDYWGPIPQASLDKTAVAYGKDALASLVKITDFLSNNEAALDKALASMGMDAALSHRITAIMLAQINRIDPNNRACHHDADIPHALAEELFARGIVAQKIDLEQGRYLGAILIMSGDRAVQDLGRNTAAVHQLPAWQNKPAIGEQYVVKYSHGQVKWAHKGL